MSGGGSVIGGFAFGHGVTSSDPAFLRILAKSERYGQVVARQACTFAKSIFLEEGTENCLTNLESLPKANVYRVSRYGCSVCWLISNQSGRRYWHRFGRVGTRPFAGSLLVMAIVGGAVLTPIMGLIAEAAHHIAVAYTVPLVSYIAIAFYSYFGSKPSTVRG
jgi:hypothetical protein